MRILLVLTLLAAAVMSLQAQDVKSDSEKQIMARITVSNALDMQRVNSLGLDLMEYREGDELIFLTTQKQLDELRNAGWNVRLDEQLTAELPRPGDTETFLGGYRTVEETFAFLNQMASNYPQLAQVFTYGQSWEKMRNPLNGYNLTGIKLTNRQIGGTKPRILIGGWQSRLTGLRHHASSIRQRLHTSTCSLPPSQRSRHGRPSASRSTSMSG